MPLFAFPMTRYVLYRNKMLAFSSFLTGGLDQVHGGFLARQSSRSPRVTCKEAQGRNPGEPGWEGGLARAKGRDRNGLLGHHPSQGPTFLFPASWGTLGLPSPNPPGPGGRQQPPCSFHAHRPFAIPASGQPGQTRCRARSTKVRLNQ